MELTTKLEIFAQVLAETDDQAEAYRAMVPNTKAKPESIWVSASRFASDTKVKLRVAELKLIAKELADKKFGVTFEQKMDWLTEVTERSLQAKAATDSEGNVVGDYKFSGGDAVRAINEMNKMSGDHAAEKRDYNGNIGLSVIDEKSIISALERKYAKPDS